MLDRFNLRLREHQQANLDFFRKNQRAISLLPYGSGKAAVAVKRAGDLAVDMRILIVTTNGTVLNWLDELKAWGHPRWNIATLIGTKKERTEIFRAPHNIAVINHEGVRVMLESVGAEFPQAYGCVIIDELHRAKHHDTDVSMDLAFICHPQFAKHVYGLTGSPVLESPIDLFSIMRIVDPTIFGDNFEAWRDRYFMLESVEKEDGEKSFPKWVCRPGALAFLSEKLHSISFYRGKDNVEVVYPTSVMNKPIYVKLRGQVLKKYNEVEKHLTLSLRDSTISLVNIRPRLEKLCQLARGWCYDINKEPVYFPEMAALDAFTEYMEDMRGMGRTCVWAVRPPEMSMLAHVLDSMGIKYRIIYGKLRSLEARKKITKLFNDGYIEVLIAQPRCMGEGLNIQAQNSFRYSYRWSAMEWSQPMGRFTRISSHATFVRYWDVVAKNTVDEGIIKSIDSKLDIGEIVKAYKRLPWRVGPKGDVAYAPSL